MIKDYFGSSPMVGDRIIYYVRNGGSVTLVRAMVTSIEEGRLGVHSTRDRYGRRKEYDTWLHASNFVVLR